MTTDEQQTALCEWAGWRPNGAGYWHKDGRVATLEPEAVDCDQHYEEPELLPDTNSLDVLAEFEGKLPEMNRGRYMVILDSLSDPNSKDYIGWNTVTATAAQRREAMLRTLGLWKD